MGIISWIKSLFKPKKEDEESVKLEPETFDDYETYKELEKEDARGVGRVKPKKRVNKSTSRKKVTKKSNKTKSKSKRVKARKTTKGSKKKRTKKRCKKKK